VEPIRSAQKRPVTSSATASLIRRSQPVMHRRMLLRDVPLPARAFAAWPIRVVLPSARIGGAHGVLAPFAGLLPRRVTGHFCPAGPTCLFVQPHAPIDFRRVDLPSLREHESRDWRQIARAPGLASGLRSRLRSVSPRVRQTAMSASTPEDRSCLGLCLLQGFRARTCAFGRARPRPDHPTPRTFLMPFIRSWAYIRL